MDESVAHETLEEMAQTFLAFVETSEPTGEALRRLTEAGYEVRVLVTADRKGEIGQGPLCLLELTVDHDSEGSRAEAAADPQAVVEEFLSDLEREPRECE